MRLRKILKIAAWAVFIFSAPVLIFYALGHKITPASPMPVAVGAFLIKTVPDNADVFLNGRIMSSRTPSAIQNLLPGAYDLQFRKKGYREWRKNLMITGTRVTDVKGVRLMPDVLEEDIMRGNVSDFSLSPKKSWLMLFEDVASGRQLRVVPFNDFTSTGKIIKLTIGKKEKYNVSWSPDEKKAFLEVHSGRMIKKYVINPETGIFNLLLHDNASLVGWIGAGNGQTILGRKGDKLLLYDLEKPDDPVIVADKIQDVAISSDGFVVLSENKEIREIVLFSSAAHELDKISIPSQKDEEIGCLEFSHTGDIVVCAGHEKKLLLWQKNEKAWRYLTNGAEKPVFSPDGEKIMWQTSEFDLWAMNLHEKRSVLPLFEPFLVARISSSVRDPLWYAGSGYLLFFENDVLKIVELDFRDGNKIEDLLGTNKGDGKAEIIENGNIIMAIVARDGINMLSRFFMLAPEDR